MAKLIETTGVKTLKPSPSFKEAQGYVGGYVETVSIPGGAVLLVNEDGIAKQLPFNVAASAIARRPIVGTAILLETKAEVKRTLG